MCFFLLAAGCFTTLTPVPLEAKVNFEGSLGQQLSEDAYLSWYHMDEAGLQIVMYVVGMDWVVLVLVASACTT